MPLQQLSTISCKACRSRKRKCTKALPKCDLCTRRGLHCTYAPQPISKQQYDQERERHQIVLQQASPSSTASRNEAFNSPAVQIVDRYITPDQKFLDVEFPSVHFLDSKISQQYHVKLPIPEPPVPPHITSTIGDLHQRLATGKTFFQTIHKWLPIVSKKRFYEFVNPLCALRADYALLVLCMDFMSWVPGQHCPNVRIPKYIAAKQYQLHLETSGVLSLQALQASILIAVFELGHAIYPSAFLSVAACARYGYALGLGWNKASPHVKPLRWIESEERTRVWWAITLLDRLLYSIANVGKPELPLLIPNPGVDVCLPGSDGDWDEGTKRSQVVHTVTTPTIEWGDMGPFALVAQASRLLGLVLEHISDPSNLDEEEALILDRALTALTKVIVVEGELRYLHMMNQQAICSIAIILLHEIHASQTTKIQYSEYFENVHYIKTYIADITRSIADTPEDDNNTKPLGDCVKEGSIFLVPLLYLGACILNRIHKEQPTSESLKNFNLVKYVLSVFDTRWKAAGEYLKVLQARELALE